MSVQIRHLLFTRDVQRVGFKPRLKSRLSLLDVNDTLLKLGVQTLHHLCYHGMLGHLVALCCALLLVVLLLLKGILQQRRQLPAEEQRGAAEQRPVVPYNATQRLTFSIIMTVRMLENYIELYYIELYCYIHRSFTILMV